MTVRSHFDPEATRKILHKIPLFSHFNDKEISLILENTTVYSCKKGEVIFDENDENRQMYIVLKGCLKVVESTVDGQERIMAYRKKGSSFGDMGIIDGKTDYAMMIATEASKLLMISKSVFEHFFMHNNESLRELVDVLCNRLRESWLFQTILGASDAESKVRVTLARYGTLCGIADDSGVIININLSHQGLADRIMVTRETVTRVLGRMRDLNEIESTGGRIKLLPAFFENIDQCRLYNILKAKQGEIH